MMTGQLLAPVHTLGPGRRVTLWTQGCSKHCKGCISPELKEKRKETEIPVEFLAEIIRQASVKNKCTGLTISGGDPFEQPDELVKLLKLIRNDFEDILVYTGFVYEQLQDGMCQEALNYIDVLIDGPYVQEKNIPKAVLRGSENQRMIYLNPVMEEKYRSYLECGRQLENFNLGNRVVTVGIPDKRFIDEEAKG